MTTKTIASETDDGDHARDTHMPSAATVRGGLFLGACLLLIAFNLRPLFSSLSVLLPEVSQALSLSGVTAGYLTTLPVLCLGLFAPFAPSLADRFGVERVLLFVLILIGAGTALRVFDFIPALFLGSAMAGAGIAMGNVLLPSVVKRDFPDRVALMTGLFTMSLCGGAAAAAALAVPLAEWGGSWQFGLGIWALPAFAVALFWTPYSLRSTRPASTRHLPRIRLLHDGLAWQVACFMGLQSALAYCVLGWMAPILRWRGLDGMTAGLYVSASVMVQVATCLLVPPLAARLRSQSLLNAGLALLAALALAGLVLAPVGWLPVLAVLQGVGQGGLFAIAMTVIILRSPDPRVAARLSGMSQTIGYLLAAFGPMLVGGLYASTGGHGASAWLIMGIGLAAMASGWGAGRPLLVRPRE
ncbi:MAG TPA: MFS transporter [Burkholderiaceae bacterium]|jgi:CP family cyanate transporter-like MFS transporter|nr:MFS transporter [Burkholderiaceae bacterium]